MKRHTRRSGHSHHPTPSVFSPALPLLCAIVGLLWPVIGTGSPAAAAFPGLAVGILGGLAAVFGPLGRPAVPLFASAEAVTGRHIVGIATARRGMRR